MHSFRQDKYQGKRLLTGLIALFLFTFLLIQAQTAVAGSKEALVDTKWLGENLKNPSITILHVGSFFVQYDQDYKSNHIPGALYMSVGDVMNALGNGSKAPDAAAFEGVMGRLGISSDSHVILYGDNGNNALVPTAYWLMNYFGHDKVSILDGSLAKWKNDKRETTAQIKNVTATKYKATPDAAMFVNADQVQKAISNPKAVIVDVRSVEEYKGLKSMGPAPKIMGHIKGAVNLDYEKTNLNADGTFKSVNDLKSAYEAQGVKKDKEIIVYCDGGVRAANTVFVLKSLLGYPNVKNYVGSWGEWGNRLDPAKYPTEK